MTCLPETAIENSAVPNAALPMLLSGERRVTLALCVAQAVVKAADKLDTEG